jgi:hypothetical protein
MGSVKRSKKCKRGGSQSRLPWAKSETLSPECRVTRAKRAGGKYSNWSTREGGEHLRKNTTKRKNYADRKS